MSKIVKFGKVVFCCFGLVFAGAEAKVSPEEAAQLGITGTPLTPIGAVRAGNAEGTIPEWTGGLAVPPPGYKLGGPYVDPYADDKILFTIDASNYQQYEDKLSPGNIALMKKYPDTYKLNIYPTRRSAAYPEFVYENSIWNAANLEFCPEYAGTLRKGRCIHKEVYRAGMAFPIPKTGEELMWTRLNSYWAGETFTATGLGFNVYADGTYATNIFNNKWSYPIWYKEGEVPDHPYYQRNGGANLCRGQEVVAPPRSAGQIFGGCTFLEDTDFDGYIYIPGQRRVRKAPELGFYDSPATGSDGLRTADSFWSFATVASTEEWYDLADPVKQELFVPYNSFLMAKPGQTLDDLVRPGHINPELVRYELHRVWVQSGELLPGFRHIGPKRLAYADEDSWTSPTGVMWDAKGEMWRVTETYIFPFYEVPTTSLWGDAHMDLISGRYSATDAFYEMGMTMGLGTTYPNWNVYVNPGDMTPAGLRRLGVR